MAALAIFNCRLTFLELPNGVPSHDTIARVLSIIDGKQLELIFTDWVRGAEVAELMGNCALFVHPSGVEGLPIVVLEAMAAKRPVLVSDILEHREIIPDERCWYRFGDIADLASSMSVFLASSTLRSEIRKNNFERSII